MDTPNVSGSVRLGCAVTSAKTTGQSPVAASAFVSSATPSQMENTEAVETPTNDADHNGGSNNGGGGVGVSLLYAAADGSTAAGICNETTLTAATDARPPQLCPRNPLINVKPIAKLMLGPLCGGGNRVISSQASQPPALTASTADINKPLAGKHSTPSSVLSISTTTTPTPTTLPATAAAAPPPLGLIKQPPPLHINHPHPQYQMQLSNQQLQQQKDTDEMRKKRRCTDRYDSSESSDSGVATLSNCTDSSTASSDGSDPGSPYSPSSSSGDDHNTSAATKSSSSHNSTVTPGGTTGALPAQQPLLPALVSSLASKTVAMGSHAHTKATTLPHIWPWSNNFTITNTGSAANNPAGNGGAPLSSIQPPPLVKGGQKRNSEPSTQSSVAAIKKMRGAMAKPLALVAAAPKLKAISASNPGISITPMLSVGMNSGGGVVGNPQTKITGFFKSQIKPVNNLKRASTGNNGGDITGLVVRSTDFPKHLQTSKSNINTSQQLINPTNIQKVTCDIDVRTVHVATSCANPLQQTMPSSATTIATATTTTKLERKTAKVAPLVPITRKTTGNCLPTPNNVVPAKKPVTIAPRIDGGPPKVPVQAPPILSNSRVQPLPQQMVTPMQQHQQPHQHTMPQLTIGGSIVTSLSPPALVSTSNQKNSKNLMPIYQAGGLQNTNNSNAHLLSQAPANMPKLVQIPNVAAQSQTQTRYNPTNRAQQLAITPTQSPATIQATSSGQETAAHYFVNGALIKLQPAPPTHQQTHLGASKSFAMQPATSFNPHQQLFMATSTGLLLTATSTAANGIPTMLSNMPMPALHPYATAQSQQQQQLQTTHFQQQPQQQQLQFQTLQQQLHHMSLIMPPQFAAATQQQQQMIQPQLGNSCNASAATMQQKPQQQQQQQQQQPIFFAHRGNVTSAFLPAGSAPFQQCPTVAATNTHNIHNAIGAHPAVVAHANTGNTTSALLPAGCATFQQCPTVANTSNAPNHTAGTVFASVSTNALAPLSQSNSHTICTTTTLNPTNPTPTASSKMTIPPITTRTAMCSPPPLISTNTPPPLCISKPFVQHCSSTAQRLSKCSITITTAPPPALCSVSKRTAPLLATSPEQSLLTTAPASGNGTVSALTPPTEMPSLTPIIDTVISTSANTARGSVATPAVDATAASLTSKPVDVLEENKPTESANQEQQAADRLQISPRSALQCRQPQSTALSAISAISQQPVGATKSPVPIIQASPKSLVLERIQRLKPELPHPVDSPRTPVSTKRLLVSTSTPINSNTSLDSSSSLLQTPPLPDCAKSPILSQPKTIRFPAAAGTSRGSGARKSDGRLVGVCYWDDCTERYDTSSKLLDHLQTQHVNGQTGPFSCEWSGCKVHGRESCSRRWLERHVLLHGGTKLFKCIVDGCGLRFGSQLALQKHVNSHFNATENQKDQKDRRSSDPPVPKKLRVTGKKLRYRRQPFSARMFDFFDAGVMEVLQHRLACTEKTTCGERGAVVFVGHPIVRRVSSTGCIEHLVQWTPPDILPDEWLPENSPLFTSHSSQSPLVDAAQHSSHENLSSACSSSGASETSSTAAFSLTSTSAGSSSSSCASKTVSISCMSAAERIALHEYLQVTFAQSEQMRPDANANRVELLQLLATARDGENSGASSSSSSSTHSSSHNSSSSGVSSTDSLPSQHQSRLTSAQQPATGENEESTVVAPIKRNRRKTTARSSGALQQQQQQHQQWSTAQLSSMWSS